MQRLLRYLARYRARYAVGMLCLFGTASLAMAVPYLFKWAVDAYAAGAGAGVVGRYAAAMAAIAVVQAVVRTFSRFMIFNVGRDVEYDLRNDLFAKLEQLPQGFYQRRSTGDLMSRLVNDITALRLLLGVGGLNLVNTAIYYVYGVALMCTLDPRLTLWALVPFPLLVLTVKRFSRQIMERSLRVQEGLGDLSTRIQENLSGIHVVQAYGRAHWETTLFSRLNERFAEQNMALARVRGVLMPVMKFMASAGTVIILWVGGLRVMAGELSIGGLFAFAGYLNLLAWPTMALGWLLSILQRGRAAMRRLDEIFEAPVDIADAAGAVTPAAVAGAIEFRDVDFSYGEPANGAPVLKGINLSIPAGATVAVVGRTGSGKSTLAQLLPRLFDPSAGAILLDGRDIRELPLGWLRRQIAVVPQDPFLFSASVRDNIAFGVAAANDGDGNGAGANLDARVQWAAAAAGLSRDIPNLPQGFDTVVGERGVALSGGQKQRVTLARALLVEPRVLILDDALSSVDTQTEREVLRGLTEFLRERTSIVIAHRLSTIEHADLIVVIDEGRIVESGDHDSLLARDGIYADLFRRQRLEEEIEAI
jgi:ATP-binding cassette subfamily B protein